MMNSKKVNNRGSGVDPNIQQAAQNELIKTIGNSGNKAANALMLGGRRVGETAQTLERAIPGARQAYANQAGQALAAGAAQAGRGGASAYGGALQGGLAGTDLANKFEISAQQQLANAYRNQAGMASEGAAIQAATAGKLLEFGTQEERLQRIMGSVQAEISKLIDSTTSWYGDNTNEMRRKFNQLAERYGSDPQIRNFIFAERDKAIANYSGYDGGLL